MVSTKKRKRKPFNYTYTKDEYNSGDGMLTTVWGPSMWHSLHSISFNYPVFPTTIEKKQYMNFIKSLQYVLPCKYCRVNLTNNFKQFPLTMDKMENRETFSKYIYELHQIVNKMLKKSCNLTYDEVRERYEHFRARCSANDEKHKTFSVNSLKKLSSTSSKEKGCTTPLYGKKSKCILRIVPHDYKCDTFKMHKSCVKTRKQKRNP
jgi:hypothetical protein